MGVMDFANMYDRLSKSIFVQVTENNVRFPSCVQVEEEEEGVVAVEGELPVEEGVVGDEGGLDVVEGGCRNEGGVEE